MTHAKVHVRELAGWGFDNYEHRPNTFYRATTSEANRLVKLRPPFRQPNVVLERETAQLHDTFLTYAARPDLPDEMTGLAWSLGVVDLRSIIAFQRRISFAPELPRPLIPAARDWPALLGLSFGSVKPVECDLIQDPITHTLVLRSTNPNLHVRTSNNASAPLTIHAGGPFFEVASFRDRWFLRDGYHRAYTLLQAGIYEVPAVIVEARSIAELGAVQPWFFSEDILFSETPPLVSDFLVDDLIIEYSRPPLIKTLRITIEETLSPASPTGEQP
jgi:hypothetical protein